MFIRRALCLLALCLSVSSICYAVESSDFKLLKSDLKMMAQGTNELRMKALTDMLDKRQIKYTIETFPPITAFASPQPPEGNNIVVTLGPETGAAIVLCAHYDAASMSNGKLSKGAVDNGAAVVALIRVIESLKNEKLKHQVRFLFADQEEVHARGSMKYILKHKDDKILSAINVDIVSTGDNVICGPCGTSGDNGLCDVVKAVCESKKLMCTPREFLANSDQESFHDAGVPSVTIMIRPADDTKLGIHSAADTPDAVSPKSMIHAHDVALEVLKRLDAEIQ